MIYNRSLLTFYLAGPRRHTFYLLFASPLFVAALQTQCPWGPVSPFLQSMRKCAVPVDDDSEPSQDTPWTHEPSCVVPDALESPQKFCIYSSSAFNYGSGVSLIARPETAASVAGAILDPLPAWRARRHLARWGKLDTDMYDLPYTVVPIPGKGLGVVATRRIQQFETIMTSFPAIIADNEFFPAKEGHGLPEDDRLFQKALDQLTDKQRLLTLARSKREEVHVVDDVIRTNAFGITVDGRDLKALYPEIAVCSPLHLVSSDIELTDENDPNRG